MALPKTARRPATKAPANTVTDGNNTVTSFSLTHKKSTKGTEVYEDATGKHPVSSVYIAKSAFPGEAPPQITMTISF